MKIAELSTFMTRYFPTFLAGYFSALFGMAIVTALWGSVYRRSVPSTDQYDVILGAVWALIWCLGHFVMVRGYSWGMWVNWAAVGLSLLLGLIVLGSGQFFVLLGVGLVLQLISLLIFNSHRHREMRARLIEIGIERRRA
ncbi:hypothetical protein [Pseudomonas phoenicis]|uniref:hypothetical protein n=1 Tax=unclassified Pseudomonas TaxID=196821 RepID=UPI0039A32D83